jgi:hypothetical protein
VLVIFISEMVNPIQVGRISAAVWAITRWERRVQKAGKA